MGMKSSYVKLLTVALALQIGCSSDDKDNPPVEPDDTEFFFGADLSYVNQILDKGGVYKVQNVTQDPYKIFADHGTQLVRLRLWHNPVWTKEVYSEEGTQFYNDILDVGKSISRARSEGMKVLLDFHYSDRWADPSNQKIPAAWTNISDVGVLADSVYNYTLKTLTYLNSKNLLPEFVQVGNEINCGMLISDAPAAFPDLNVCEGKWVDQGIILNAAIRAVRKASEGSAAQSRVILHVADPENVEWWFDNITTNASVTDFDVIGFSYYPLWHTTVPVSDLSAKISLFRSRYSKGVMILETGYPWTTDANDSYNNHFGSEPAIAGFPKTPQGQYDMLVKLTQEVRAGGGIGIIYWEPAWISSGMKDLWGTGSSWENCAFFDFDGNAGKAFDFIE